MNIGSASRIHGRRPVVGEWADDAACRGSDPELFHPGPHDPWLPVVEVCRTCPVVAPCLEHALRWGEAGIWGGTTTAQRRRMIAKGPR